MLKKCYVTLAFIALCKVVIDSKVFAASNTTVLECEFNNVNAACKYIQYRNKLH